MSRISAIISLPLLISGLASAGPKVLPVLNHPLPDRDFAAGYSTLLDLNGHFGMEAIDDEVVRFTTQFTSGTPATPVVIDMALFSDRTPITRSNFLKYVSDGDYVNSFIHRSVAGFVIQGGGFKVTSNSIVSVPTDSPIVNEFGVSNTLGTISMAKSEGNPDSATSQWFVSNGANSNVLDPQNGGFTVFGRVTRATFENAQTFNSTTTFPIYNKSIALGIQALNELPLFYTHVPASGVKPNELILFSSVELVPIPADQAGESTELTYSIVSNSDPAVATVTIQAAGKLDVAVAAGATSSAMVTIRATDSVGNTVDDSFLVKPVKENFAIWRNRVFTAEDATNDLVSGPNVDLDGDGLTNLELFIHGFAPGTHQNPVKVDPQVTGSSAQPKFIFPIRNDILSAGFILEQSSDLGTTDEWKPTPFQEVSRITTGVIDQLTIQGDATISADSSFFRLRFNIE